MHRDRKITQVIERGRKRFKEIGIDFRCALLVSHQYV